MYDVIIIGAGVTGAAVARELSRYQIKVCVLEKEEDVCAGTSKANSAIIHAGFDAGSGTLMARLNVRGNEMMDELCQNLDISFRRNGSMVAGIDSDQTESLSVLYERGIKNGVEGLEIIDGKRAREMEPNLSEDVIAVLYAPTGGIICPFELNIAMAENAYTNGVEFFLNTEVNDIIKNPGDNYFYQVKTNKGEFQARYIVNAAGVYADKFHNMVSVDKIHITPRRGEYCLLDKETGSHISHTIFQQPTKLGKGVLVTPTIHGNLLLGPTALDISDKEATNTTRVGMGEVLTKAGHSVRDIPVRKVITSFAGLRAHEDNGEFIVGEVEDAPQFIDCAGIESPGLSSCPAIGEMVGDLLRGKMKLKEKKEWVKTRKGILNPQDIPFEERVEFIKTHPSYGNIICRCESISEGEIEDAINRPLGAKSLDGVKRRIRAGAGRCQGGFCSPRVMEIIHRNTGLPYENITKSGDESEIIESYTKEAKK